MLGKRRGVVRVNIQHVVMLFLLEGVLTRPCWSCWVGARCGTSREITAEAQQ